MYFNKTHERTGSLFQGTYKAVFVKDDNQLLHLSRYIHQNPIGIWKKPLKTYPYSSYAEYLGYKNTSWIHTKEILAFFKTRRRTKTIDFLSYESFVDQPDETTQEVLVGVSLD
jgi:putative transposase